jgi:hypothetical protein
VIATAVKQAADRLVNRNWPSPKAIGLNSLKLL